MMFVRSEAQRCLMCVLCRYSSVVFFFKQKTAYEMRISDWSSDVCSSDLAQTTNNRMEMMAAIAAIESVKRRATIELYTDRNYLRDGITKWIHGWKKKGWKKKDKKPGKNVDLWQRQEAAIEGPQANLHRVTGHYGHPATQMVEEMGWQGSH